MGYFIKGLRRKAVNYTLVLSLFLLVFFSSVKAQNLNNQKFRSYTLRMGLSSNHQSCIAQDHEGFVWIGTMDGLDRFDGNSFKTYKKISHDSNSLQSNVILSLCVDKGGELWVGTSRGGLSRYNREQDNFTSYRCNFYDSTTLASDVVTALVADTKQQLWAATYEGICLVPKEGNQFKRYVYKAATGATQKSLAFNQVSTLAQDGNILWIGYFSGTISAFDITKKTFTHYPLFDIASRNIKEFMVTGICVDGDMIWISTWGKGVWLFTKKTKTVFPFANTKYHFTNGVYKDNQGQVWLSTQSDGLVLVKNKNAVLSEYRHDDLDKYSLSSNCISNVFQDNQGSLWIGNKKGCLHYLDTKNKFQVWRKHSTNTVGLMKNDVSCMLEDSKHRLWIGYAEGGIEIFDLMKDPRKNTIPKIPFKDYDTGTINSIFESHDGTIWIGTFLGGLKKYDEVHKKFISYKYDLNDSTSISCNNVRQITEDTKGNLWLALHGGGLATINPKVGKFRHYRVNYRDLLHTINSDWLLSVLCDGDKVWVGSVSGISVLNKNSKEVKHYRNSLTDSLTLSNENINVILKDSRGHLWIGTNDGINEIDRAGNIIKIYTTHNGLPHGIITSISEDAHHTLWIGTNHGLARFNPSTGTFTNYFSEDGLETDEFIVGSYFKNSKGGIYLGGLGGLNYFHPDSLRKSNFTSPLYITGFKLFNQSIPIQENTTNSFSLPKQARFMNNITLDYDQNIIGFEFVALDYLNQHKIQYAYTMEGFDKTWVYPSPRHEAIYTNLHPGKYTFKIKASSGNSTWYTDTGSLHILIKPPFWKTGLAYALYVILVIAFLYAFWILVFRHASMVKKLEMEELEIKKLQKMDAKKMDFFSNISHEFRTPLTLLVGPLENLLKSIKDEFQLHQLKIAYRNSNRLLRLINQLMDFSKLETEGLKLELTQFDIVKFSVALSLSFMGEAKQRHIDFKINTINNSLVGWFDRDKFEKIMYTIIGNAFKFTPAHGHIIISISTFYNKGNTSVKLMVNDTGLGISEESIPEIFDRFYQVDNGLANPGTGIGLALAQELAKLHGGSISVDSKVGLGSTFSIIIPAQAIPGETPSSLNPVISLTYTETQTTITNPEGNNHTQEGVALESMPRLLIIEDNVDMRLFIKHEFMGLYSISEASDGLVGFEKACAELPDIILCDVMMPGMDGISLCKKLKSTMLTSHIPIIILTAKNSDSDTLKGLEGGANDYVTKPFKASILKAKIKNLITLRREVTKRFVSKPTATLKEISPTPVDEKFLKKACQVVEDNLSNQQLDVGAFSLAIGMSRAQLYRKIQSLSGQSVKEFIRIIRLRKAAEMLLSTELNISQIAFEVGFSSVAYFTKSFSSYFGINPSKYSAANKKNKNNNVPQIPIR